MKWIKASERFPKKHEQYYTLLENNDKELSWFYPDSSQWDNHSNEDVVQWLDESPTPASDGVEEKIRELASLRVPHIAPYNLGDMGKINDLIIELERLLPPQTQSKD